MKKMMLILAVVMCVMAGSAMAAIVADGSFEDQAVGEGLYWEYPDGTTPWSYSAAAIVDGPAMLVKYPVGGNPTAGSTGDQFMGTWGGNVYQTVSLEIGQEYQVSLMAAATGTGAEYVKVHLPGAIDPSTGVLWVDPSGWGGGWMPNQAINNTWTAGEGGASATPDEWELHTFNFIAAEDGDQTFYVQGSNQAWMDDVAITIPGDVVIIAQPQNQQINDGGIAVFSVTGFNIDNYQWYYSADPNTETPGDDVQLSDVGIVAGATTDTLTLAGATVAGGDAGYYFCIVSDNETDPNTPTSNTAELTINAMPEITAQPQNQQIDDPGTAVFSVTGANIDNYQWYYSTDLNTETTIDNVQLSDVGIVTGATTDTLTLTGATVAGGDAGYYFCIVSDNEVVPNTATSNTAALTFNVVGQLEPEAHWTLDVDGSDLTGNHNGTFVGAPDSVAGQDGGAFDFAAGEYLSLDTAFDRPDAFTITAWVKTTATGEKHIFGWTDPTYGALFRINSGVLEYGEWDGVTYGNITAGSGLNDGQWHHVAVTFDNTATELYIDGVPANSGTVATTYGTIAVTAVSVGNLGDWTPATRSITGSLDDVRLYDTALGVAEIEDIYYATVEGPICLDPPQGDTNGDCIVDTADLAAFIAEWLD